MYLEKNRLQTNGLLTISSVNVSPDLKNARILITLLGGDDSRVQALLEQLNNNVALYQKHLAGALRLRVTPRLHFEYDRHLERANRITDIIDNLDHTPD